MRAGALTAAEEITLEEGEVVVLTNFVEVSVTDALATPRAALAGRINYLNTGTCKCQVSWAYMGLFRNRSFSGAGLPLWGYFSHKLVPHILSAGGALRGAGGYSDG